MKRLYIVRHAKSLWDEGCGDFDRSLNQRGFSDAKLIAKELQDRSILPDLIVSSPANRAKTTASIIAKEIGYPLDKIEYKESIYESTTLNIMMLLKELDESYKSVMLFGHNPALTSVANSLLNSYWLDNLKTCGVVAFEFDGEWSSIDRSSIKKEFYIYPKMFKV